MAESTIYWPIIWLALCQFKAAEQCTLQKFMHEWLPLQDRYHVQSTSTNHVCPSCWQATETVDHFLACRHHAQQQIWKELHKSLFQNQTKHEVSNVFHDILVFGLYQGWQEPTTIQTHHLPTDLNNLYSSQHRMGWKQLYYRWFTPLWHDLLQTYHPQVNGNHYCTKILQLIWQATLKIWKICNEHLHPGNPEQEDRSQLQAAVDQIFEEAQHNPQLQVLVENLDPDQIMTCPVCSICQWVTNSNNHMWAHLKEAKPQACLRTHDICQYFPQCPPNPHEHQQIKTCCGLLRNNKLVWVVVSIPNGASDNTISNKFFEHQLMKASSEWHDGPIGVISPLFFTITMQCTTNTNQWQPPIKEHNGPICKVLLATPFSYQSHQPMKASHKWHNGPIGCVLNVDIGHTYTH